MPDLNCVVGPQPASKTLRKTVTTKLDGNRSSWQFANNIPLLRVTGNVIALTARMDVFASPVLRVRRLQNAAC